MGEKPLEVAIIGAGLAGTLLALALHIHLPLPASNITIYESRAPTAPELASGIILTPNGLRILDKLGVYARIKDICWTNEYRTYKNDKDVTTRRVLVASEALYGFRNHRLYRRVFLQVVKDMVAEAGIKIHYNQRFEGIISDSSSVSSSGVMFKINGVTHRTSLLIGADGIYSSVRRHLNPNIVPEYTGTMGVLAHIKWSSVSWPTEDFERQCTIQGKPGAFFMIPETKDGSEVMVGRQFTYPDRTRKEWETLSQDTEAMCELWRQGYSEWHETGRKVVDAVTDPDRGRDTLYLWPFLRMPKLTHWFTPTTPTTPTMNGATTEGTIILVGDAAHAIPPSSGQGVNQALEDVWSLTLLLRQTVHPRLTALTFWQSLRQKRIDAVYDWATNATNVQRMPEAERRRLIEEGKVPDPEGQTEGDGDGEGKGNGNGRAVDFFDDMKWLYDCRSESEIEEWISNSGVGGDANGSGGGGGEEINGV